jgi:hypothetical protein
METRPPAHLGGVLLLSLQGGNLPIVLHPIVCANVAVLGARWFANCAHDLVGEADQYTS